MREREKERERERKREKEKRKDEGKGKDAESVFTLGESLQNIFGQGASPDRPPVRTATT